MAPRHSDEFKRDAVRIAQSSGLTLRQVASDLGIGLFALGKWVRAITEEAKVPTQDAELLRENERLRKESRILRVWPGQENSPGDCFPGEWREVLIKAAMFFAAQKPWGSNTLPIIAALSRAAICVAWWV
jgi:transposase